MSEAQPVGYAFLALDIEHSGTQQLDDTEEIEVISASASELLSYIETALFAIPTRSLLRFWHCGTRDFSR